MSGINTDAVVRELAKKCGLKISNKSCGIVLRDKAGCETFAARNAEVVDVLYSEIFEDGKYEGKKETVEEITRYAQLM